MYLENIAAYLESIFWMWIVKSNFKYFFQAGSHSFQLRLMAIRGHHLLGLGFLFVFHDGQRVERKILTKWLFLWEKYEFIHWGFCFSPPLRTLPVFIPSLHLKNNNLYSCEEFLWGKSAVSVLSGRSLLCNSPASPVLNWQYQKRWRYLYVVLKKENKKCHQCEGELWLWCL